MNHRIQQREGSSGSSRGLPNVIVLPIDNSSIDTYSEDLQKITEGKGDPTHKYYKLKDRIKYHHIIYDPNEKLYKLNTLINPSANEGASPPTDSGESSENPPAEADREVSSNAAEQKQKMTLDKAMKLAKAYTDLQLDLPADLDAIVNPKDINKKLYNLLQHEFWTENSIPVYQNDPDWQDISMNPDKPESFVNYFWQDKDLLTIVSESNKYIDKKNQLKNKYHPNKKKTTKEKSHKKHSTH